MITITHYIRLCIKNRHRYSCLFSDKKTFAFQILIDRVLNVGKNGFENFWMGDEIEKI